MMFFDITQLHHDLAYSLKDNGADILPMLRHVIGNQYIENNLYGLFLVHANSCEIHCLKYTIEQNGLKKEHLSLDTPIEINIRNFDDFYINFDYSVAAKDFRNNPLLALPKIIQLCKTDYRFVERLGVFNQSYLDLIKKLESIFELEDEIKTIEKNFNYYQTLARDLAKYLAPNILQNAINQTVEELKSESAHNIYVEEDCNLWEEICVCMQKPDTELSFFDGCLEFAIYNTIAHLSNEDYMTLLMTYTDFEKDYYEDGEGYPEHWHDELSLHGEVPEKLFNFLKNKILSEAYEDNSPNVNNFLGYFDK